MSSSPLSSSTSVAVGLVAVLLSLAFGLGIYAQRLATVETALAEVRMLQVQQAELIRQNNRRIDLLDQSQADYDIRQGRFPQPLP